MTISPEGVAEYYDILAQKLTDPTENQQPIIMTCSLIDEELCVRITDQGEGFAIDQVSMDPHDTTFGRGVYLVRKFAQHTYYEDGGRTAVFTLPSKVIMQGNAAPSRLSIKKHAKILLAEKDTDNLKIICDAFKHSGYQNIATATTGSDALAKIQSFQPDLILLSTKQTDTDGFAMCQQLKADERTQHIPVLLTSQGYNPEERAKGYRIGAVDFVNQPIDLNELIARAEIHIMNQMMFKHVQAISTKFSHDLEKARQFQVQMLPQPELLEPLCANHNVIIEHDYKASENLGGDYWTILDLDDSHVALVLADFTGHGVLAAMNTIRLHALLNELAPSTLINPIATARALNKKLFKVHDQQGVFATFLYVVLDTYSGQFKYVGCGAPGMFVVHEQEEPTYLSTAGIPLGLLPADEFNVELIQGTLKEGDTLFTFSDSLTENIHHNGNRWLEDGIKQAIMSEQKELTNTSTSQILWNVRECFNKTACMPLTDDLTLVSITYAP